MSSGVAIWSPIVDRFLASQHLMLRERLIEISLREVAAPASLSARDAFKTRLARSHGSGLAQRLGPSTPLQQALASCRRLSIIRFCA